MRPEAGWPARSWAARRGGWRFRLRVISAMSAARAACGGSGGKGRRGDGPADDTDGPGELDPVRVDVGLGGGLADQGADRVMGEQVAVDLLADHVRALGPQHPAGSAQVCLELVVAGLVLPALVIALRQDRR